MLSLKFRQFTLFIVAVEVSHLINSISWAKPIVLNKGEYFLLPVTGMAPVYNSSSKVLKIRDEGHQLRLLGKTFGSSSLSIDKKNYQIIVTTKTQKDFAQAMSTYLANRPGLKLQIDHPCHLITGELLRWSDWQVLKRISTEMGGCYRFSALIAPEIETEVIQRLSEKLQDPNWGIPRIHNIETFSVEYSNSVKKEHKYIKKKLKPWGLTPFFSSGTIAFKPLVRIKILVAEINRQYVSSFGIAWPRSYSAQILPKTNIYQNWSLEIQALEQKGAGKILANPTLLTRSGNLAEFLAGGEIPFRLSHYKRSKISWKKYGVSLKVLAHTDSRGYLDVDLLAEISNPDPALSLDGLPALKTHRIQSHFNLKGSQTIALAGLIRNESGKGHTGWPGLSSIPILGRLFSSKSFLENRSELVIFVTPELANKE